MSDLLEVVNELRRRVAELERIQLAGNGDRPLRLAEVAARIGRSEATLRGWLKRPEARRRYRLEELFVRDFSGRRYSTPRRIQVWMDTLVNSCREQRRAAYRDAVAQPASRRSGIAYLTSERTRALGAARARREET